MTLPKKPWSISAHCPRTIVDFSGNIVAMVTDARQAPEIVDNINDDSEKIAELKQIISDLQYRLRRYE